MLAMLFEAAGAEGLVVEGTSADVDDEVDVVEVALVLLLEPLSVITDFLLEPPQLTASAKTISGVSTRARDCRRPPARVSNDFIIASITLLPTSPFPPHISKFCHRAHDDNCEVVKGVTFKFQR